jgi:GNAT superfamily N-acetyltransferase
MDVLRISSDPAELDVAMIHRYLSEESYWAKGITRPIVERALANSLCFGGYLEHRQVAFARVVTDRATSAHLKDVFVLREYRGRGYGLAIVEAAVSHPDVRFATITLDTNDAHELYRRFGFVARTHVERAMVRPGASLPKSE